MTVSIENQIAGHRLYLLRFARLQLRNDTHAEDVVSETLLAALTKPQTFGNKSQLKTWLVGILKHKITDTLRLRYRENTFNSESTGDGHEELAALSFQADGHFCDNPSDWGNPEQDLSSRQFFAVLEACSEKLPPSMGRVFLMREWLEMSSEEVCKTLDISPTHLYVLLHRARLRLRECLELNWFGHAPNMPLHGKVKS